MPGASAEQFDLAIDLRKHTETRPVLARMRRYLAGFDFATSSPGSTSRSNGPETRFARKRSKIPTTSSTRRCG